MPPNLAFVTPNPIVTRDQCLERIGGRSEAGPQAEEGSRCGSMPHLAARTRSCCPASVPQHEPHSLLYEQRGCVQPSCSHGALRGQRTGQNHVRRKKTSATCLHYIPSRALDLFSSLDLVHISAERGIPRLCLIPGTQCCGPRGLCCYGAAPERGAPSLSQLRAYSRSPQRERAAPPQQREKKGHRERKERAKEEKRTWGWPRGGTGARREHPRNLSQPGMRCEQTPPHPPPRTSGPSPRGWPCPGAPSSTTAASRTSSSRRPPLPITTAAAAGRDSPLPAPPSAPIL